MIRRKARSSSNDLDLATVKAAAWAWHQHGSNSDQKPNISEFYLRRARRSAPKPSRYKLEALKKAREAVKGSRSPDDWVNITLLDTHEIQRISQQLDHLKNQSHFKVNIKVHGDSLADNDGSLVKMMIRMKNKKKKLIEGFWPIRQAVRCGSTNDVAVNANRVFRDGRSREEHI
ncbi:uncharacterized protein LOC131160794 [Malania oleifera]|uniref:uncharacterized protein LOC131160794 n=1 Tax=Malania oleifera TaxID=397392 RepID=UPI0025ADA9E5|nr:uncharacterized protein LOC131160794 [Malania oleifera]